MFGSASRISMNFRLLSSNGRLFSNLKKKLKHKLESFNRFLSSWSGGKVRVLSLRRPGFRLTVSAVFGSQTPYRWKAYLPSHLHKFCSDIEQLPFCICCTMSFNKCVNRSPTQGNARRFFLIQSKEIKLISMQTFCSRGLELAALWMPHPFQNHEENELIFFLSSNFSLSYVYVS